MPPGFATLCCLLEFHRDSSDPDLSAEPTTVAGGPSTLTTLSKNLAHAMAAGRFVVSNLKAANWDQYRGEPSYEACVLKGQKSCGRLMNNLDVLVYTRVRGTNWGIEDDGVTLAELRRISMDAVRHGAGNCREFSATAFVHLHGRGASPLDWMALDADHAFVVIGRREGSTTLATWGPDAVICDPWAWGFAGDPSMGVYPATKFVERMSRIVSFQSVYSNFRSGGTSP